jgi:hypothetical protein
VTAATDLFGTETAETALALGVPAERISTIGPQPARRRTPAPATQGAVAEVVPLGQVLQGAQELAGQMTQRPHLTNKYIAVVFRQRISRRLAEGTLAGMALENLTAANLAYLQQG